MNRAMVYSTCFIFPHRKLNCCFYAQNTFVDHVEYYFIYLLILVLGIDMLNNIYVFGIWYLEKYLNIKIHIGISFSTNMSVFVAVPQTLNKI